MISTALSVKSDENGRETVRTRLVGAHNSLFVPGLYKNELRRTWSMGLLYAIILFFAIPVVTLLMYSNNVEYYTDFPERAMGFLSDYFNNTNIFVTLYACLGGLMGAMVVGEYLFDRRKTNFICSLPVKRQAYLITKASTNLTWSVLAWIPAMLLTVLVVLLMPLIRPHFALVLGGLMEMFGAWLCAYLYFFGLALLACCFCGTGVMAGCMVLMLGGYIPVLALSLIGFAEITVSHVWTSWYLSDDLFSAISGIYRIFRYSLTEMGIFFYLGTALLGILFAALAVFLAVKRKSEHAGTPFAFDRVRDTVKALLVCLAGLLGGMLFHVMSSGLWSIFWMLFGITCGAFLAWMLCNTIFYKTPKMMFTGKRAVCILTAVMMVFSLGFRFDILGFDNYVPSNTMTHEIELELNDVTFKIKDRSLIRLYNAMAKNGYAAYDQYGAGYVDKYIYHTMEEDENVPRPDIKLTSYRTVWKTRYLLPAAKNTFALHADWVTFVQTLTAQPDFADQFLRYAFEAVDTAQRNGETDIWSRVNFQKQYDRTWYEYSDNLSCEAIRGIFEVYREELRAAGADCLQRTRIGDMYFRFDDLYLQVPLYEGYDETFAHLTATLMNTDYDPTYTAEREFISGAVYKNGTFVGAMTKAEFLALEEAGGIAYDVWSYTDSESPLTLLDADYYATINFLVKETYYSYYETYDADGKRVVVTEVNPKPESETRHEETVTCGFFYGQVPEAYRAG